VVQAKKQLQGAENGQDIESPTNWFRAPKILMPGLNDHSDQIDRPCEATTESFKVFEKVRLP
jgi:hypothetical protein